MTALLLEPFFGGSHQQWAQSWQQHSRHDISLLTLPGRHWKWRMHGGAVTLAKAWLESDLQPDVLVATDMLDLPTFLGLTRRRSAHIPVLLYMHENQITYPWSPTDPDTRLQRDHTYGYVNFRSALAADSIAFNSHYHRTSFLSALPGFLRQFPDHQERGQVALIDQKSQVIPLALDLRSRAPSTPPPRTGPATILWNHRWEYDKNPDLFFSWLYRLQEEGIPFRLIILGAANAKQPAVFATAREKLAPHLVHFGYTVSRAEYVQWLQQADLLPVTSVQDFFGGSVVEAMAAGVLPILPRRLAYPEHLSRKWHPVCLYENDADGYQRLRQAVVEVSTTRRQAAAMPQQVARYDWQKQCATYDQWIARCAKDLA